MNRLLEVGRGYPPQKLGNLLLLVGVGGGDNPLLKEEAVVLVELHEGLVLFAGPLLQEPEDPVGQHGA